MRLWYQSMTRPDAWPAYGAALRRVLAAAADPCTEIDVPTAWDSGGFGLRSMRERAELVGGRLSVRSRPGGGTSITVTAPAIALP